ncbi:hypothetical protein GCM10023174_16410 [Chelativorans composti]|uniref:TRAP transporter small permease protein n=1 Tax=Chelativorans composti TaxID=768533 RepID=A0ABW5DFQ9_9HYPH
MLSRLAPLGQAFAKLLEWVALITSALVTGLLVFLVVGRYILNWSIVGVHEISLVAAMWLYMAGALIASRRREHLVVDLLPQQLTSARSRARHQILVAVITLVIACFFAAWTYQMLAWGMKRPQTVPGLSLPLWVPQASLAFAVIGCVAYASRDVIAGFKSLAAASKH